MTRTYYAPAKINLWLRVFSPDESGYHPLDTLFCAIALQDQLDVDDADDLELQVSGADVGPIENNLVFRAAHAYFEMIGKAPNARFHLHKQIPSGAGLGGGSSDAATALIALQDRNDHVASQEDLLTLAAHLGADVPFFLVRSPMALARGRGEVLQPIDPLPERAVIVVLPDFAIATRDAYRWLDESGILTGAEPEWPVPAYWDDVELRSINTFEEVLFDRYPGLRRVRDFMRDNGAGIAHVSGSGSAVFGIFSDIAAANAAQRVLALDSTLKVYLTHTLSR